MGRPCFGASGWTGLTDYSRAAIRATRKEAGSLNYIERDAAQCATVSGGNRARRPGHTYYWNDDYAAAELCVRLQEHELH